MKASALSFFTILALLPAQDARIIASMERYGGPQRYFTQIGDSRVFSRNLSSVLSNLSLPLRNRLSSMNTNRITIWNPEDGRGTFHRGEFLKPCGYFFCRLDSIQQIFTNSNMLINRGNKIRKFIHRVPKQKISNLLTRAEISCKVGERSNSLEIFMQEAHFTYIYPEVVYSAQINGTNIKPDSSEKHQQDILYKDMVRLTEKMAVYKEPVEDIQKQIEEKRYLLRKRRDMTRVVAELAGVKGLTQEEEELLSEDSEVNALEEGEGGEDISLDEHQMRFLAENYHGIKEKNESRKE